MEGMCVCVCVCVCVCLCVRVTIGGMCWDGSVREKGSADITIKSQPQQETPHRLK